MAGLLLGMEQLEAAAAAGAEDFAHLENNLTGQVAAAHAHTAQLVAW